MWLHRGFHCSVIKFHPLLPPTQMNSTLLLSFSAASFPFLPPDRASTFSSRCSWWIEVVGWVLPLMIFWGWWMLLFPSEALFNNSWRQNWVQGACLQFEMCVPFCRQKKSGIENIVRVLLSFFPASCTKRHISPIFLVKSKIRLDWLPTISSPEP